MERVFPAVDGLTIKHILLALAVGVAAGFFIVVLDQFVVQKVESAVGLTPSTA